MAGAILGISPGTRALGFCVYRNGVLQDWGTKGFPGKWSDRKLRSIINAIQSMAAQNEVASICVKLPDIFPTSMGYNQIIGSLNRIGEGAKVQIQYYTLKDLKQLHTGSVKTNIWQLMEAIATKQPELLPEYRKELSNKEGYYYKLFEAVAAALSANRSTETK